MRFSLFASRLSLYSNRGCGSNRIKRGKPYACLLGKMRFSLFASRLSLCSNRGCGSNRIKRGKPCGLASFGRGDAILFFRKSIVALLQSRLRVESLNIYHYFLSCKKARRNYRAFGRGDAILFFRKSIVALLQSRLRVESHEKRQALWTCLFWQGRRDSNTQPAVLETAALPLSHSPKRFCRKTFATLDTFLL